jgi:hypothetical protein
MPVDPSAPAFLGADSANLRAVAGWLQGVDYTATQTAPHRSRPNPGVFCPFSNGQSFSANCYAAVVGAIKHLRALRRPSHITGRVIAVYVNAVEAVSGRPWSENGKEAFKRLELRGNRNAARSVVAIARVVRILTALTHCTPRRVFGCVSHAVGGLV